MKRQFLGRLLSLFLVGTVVAGVGCKDYDDDITSLNNRIDELTTGQIASVEKQMQSLQNAVDRLDGVDSGLKDEIEALQGKAETQAGEIGKLQEELGKAASASEVEALKKQIETLESDKSKLEKRIEALESARTSLQDEIDGESELTFFEKEYSKYVSGRKKIYFNREIIKLFKQVRSFSECQPLRGSEQELMKNFDKNWILYKGNNKCRLKDYKYIKIEDYKKIYEEKYDYMEKMAEINYTKSNQVIAVISVIIAILAIIIA